MRQSPIKPWSQGGVQDQGEGLRVALVDSLICRLRLHLEDMGHLFGTAPNSPIHRLTYPNLEWLKY